MIQQISPRYTIFSASITTNVLFLLFLIITIAAIVTACKFRKTPSGDLLKCEEKLGEKNISDDCDDLLLLKNQTKVNNSCLEQINSEQGAQLKIPE